MHELPSDRSVQKQSASSQDSTDDCEHREGTVLGESITPDLAKNWLNVIGLFVGTHGLAVFLVVFYAVHLYPEAKRERGDWIRQIAEIRQLVDVNNRPITLPQAESVLYTMARQQVAIVESSAYRDFYSGYVDTRWDETDENLALYVDASGNEVVFSINNGDDAIRIVAKQYVDKIMSNNQQNNDDFREHVQRITSQSIDIGGRLVSVRVGETSLYEIWQEALDGAQKEVESLSISDGALPGNIDAQLSRKYSSTGNPFADLKVKVRSAIKAEFDSRTLVSPSEFVSTYESTLLRDLSRKLESHSGLGGNISKGAS